MLDPLPLRGDLCVREKGEWDPHPDRSHGEPLLAGEPATGHGPARGARAPYADRGPRGRRWPVAPPQVLLDTEANAAEFPDHKGKVSKTVVMVNYRRTKTYPPEGRRKRCPPLRVTAIHGGEATAPRGTGPHRLETADEPACALSQRNVGETGDRILKSGCGPQSGPST